MGKSKRYTHIDLSRHTGVQGCEEFDIRLYHASRPDQHLSIVGIKFEEVQKIINKFEHLDLFDKTSRELARYFIWDAPYSFGMGEITYKMAKARKQALYEPYTTNSVNSVGKPFRHPKRR